MLDQVFEFISTPLFNAVVWPLIMLAVGKIFPMAIPVFRGLKKTADQLADLHDRSATPNERIVREADEIGHKLAAKAITGVQLARSQSNESEPDYV